MKETGSSSRDAKNEGMELQLFADGQMSNKTGNPLSRSRLHFEDSSGFKTYLAFDFKLPRGNPMKEILSQKRQN